MMFPHLYECGKCGGPVKVTSRAQEPTKEFPCGHTDAIIYANRQVTLRGTGEMGLLQRSTIKLKLTVRQLLCWLTKRSI